MPKLLMKYFVILWFLFLTSNYVLALWDMEVTYQVPLVGSSCYLGYFIMGYLIKCFKGRMVDYRQRGKGIAKFMGIAINNVATHLGLRIYTTISPENYASLASTKAVNDIKIVKTLENGYYYIECTPKKKEN